MLFSWTLPAACLSTAGSTSVTYTCAASRRQYQNNKPSSRVRTSAAPSLAAKMPTSAQPQPISSTRLPVTRWVLAASTLCTPADVSCVSQDTWVVQHYMLHLASVCAETQRRVPSPLPSVPCRSRTCQLTSGLLPGYA